MTIISRPFGPDDASLCFAWANDPEIVRYLPSMPRPLAWEQHEQWARGALAQKGRNDLMLDLIFEPPPRTWRGPIRTIGRVHAAGLASPVPEVGIMIGDKTAWGKGYATEGVAIICDWLVRSRWLMKPGSWKECKALIHPENLASKHVFAKNKFAPTRQVGRNGQEIWVRELR